METDSKEMAVEAINGCIASIALQAYTYGQEIKYLREQLKDADERARDRLKQIEVLTARLKEFV